MTAEVAILNKTAVALATDSAVSISTPQGVKTYNTDKLFMLSKRWPVGVMVYGTASFLGIPWETVIKGFRNSLDSRSCSQTQDYARMFLKYLMETKSIFSEALQEHDALQSLGVRYSQIESQARERVRNRRRKNEKISIQEALQLVIDEQLKKWISSDDLPENPRGFSENVRRKYAKRITEICKQAFESYNLEQSYLEKLFELAILYVSKNRFEVGYSGIVVAGFGQEEIFPSVVEYLVDGMILDNLKFTKRRENVITHKMTASIMPFAQGDAVHSFVEGSDPAYLYFAERYMLEWLENYHQVLLDISSEEEKQSLATRLSEIRDQILLKAKKDLSDYRQWKHVQPLLDSVGGLPKDELAVLAEALVYLTSLKRRFSLDLETVGGPIDVAVISKGDGFVWVKRKHYFKPELNPQYFSVKYSMRHG